MKRVLITGKNSYIGTNFERYVARQYSDKFVIDTLDMIGDSWRQKSFAPYDIVFHVAGIAHADVSNVNDATIKKYYAVNTDLAIETAQKAKAEGVKQFVFMSSAIIYGDSAPYGTIKRITAETQPKPSNFYGDSKLQADLSIQKLNGDGFLVTVLRPPMIYGKGSKGNYPTLSSMAKKLPVFPDVQNERSMLYIDNLCEFLAQVMIREKSGVYWPQNSEYTRTSNMVKMISRISGHKIYVSKAWNWVVKLALLIPGMSRRLANKAFGNLSYEKSISQYDFEYQIVGLEESIRLTEG